MAIKICCEALRGVTAPSKACASVASLTSSHPFLALTQSCLSVANLFLLSLVLYTVKISNTKLLLYYKKLFYSFIQCEPLLSVFCLPCPSCLSPLKLETVHLYKWEVSQSHRETPCIRVLVLASVLKTDLWCPVTLPMTLLLCCSRSKYAKVYIF